MTPELHLSVSARAVAVLAGRPRRPPPARRPGSVRVGARSPRSTGFTIMELMIVIAIIALLLAAATLGFDNITRARLRSAASRTASAMRFAFDKATMTGDYVRMAFDMDERIISLEASEERISLSSEAEGGIVGHRARGKRSRKNMPLLPFFAPTQAEEDAQADEEELAEDQGFGIDPDTIAAEWKEDLEPAERVRPKFEPLKGMLTKKIKLPKGVQIDAVVTPRMETPAEKGKAYVYFFPQGHGEPAIVHLVDGSGRYYSVVLHPLTGQARVYPCMYRIPDDFGVSDDKRERDGRDPCVDEGGI